MKAVLALAAIRLLAVAPTAARGTSAEYSPVGKVVALLKQLQWNIQSDGTNDKMLYEKFSCWCGETSARKASTIEKAKEDLRNLGQTIVAARAKILQLSSELEETTGHIKDNEQSQRLATSIRQKANAVYMAEASEMKQAMAATEKGMLMLKDTLELRQRAEGASVRSATLLQGKGSAQAAEAAAQRAVEDVAAAVAALRGGAAGALPAAKLGLLRRFAAERARGMKYSPRSDTIVGILEGMYDTFSSDLKSKTADEATSHRDFHDLMAVKMDALATLQDELSKKSKTKVETESELAVDLQDYDDLEGQMKADINFFNATEQACDTKAAEWQERSGLRRDELQGIQDAIEILSADAAREVFTKAIRPGFQAFLQVRDSIDVNASPAGRAYAVLRAHARRTRSVQFAKLAAQVRLAQEGNFTEVVNSIDGVLDALKRQEREDTKKVDQCKEEYRKINGTMADLSWKIENNEAEVARLEALMEKYEKEKAETIKDIQDVNDTITSMTLQREEDHLAHLKAKSNDTEAIGLLEQAKATLSAYYTQHGLFEVEDERPIAQPTLLARVRMNALAPEGQAQPTLTPDEYFTKGSAGIFEDTAPDAKFVHKGHRHVEAKGIVGIIQMIIDDLHGEIAEGIREEQGSVAEFDKRLAAATKLKGELESRKINLVQAIADRGQDKTAEEQHKESNIDDLKEEKEYMASIKGDCDFVLRSFEERFQRRQEEMDGLVKAKHFLLGYQDAANLPDVRNSGVTTLLDRNGITTRRHLLLQRSGRM